MLNVPVPKGPGGDGADRADGCRRRRARCRTVTVTPPVKVLAAAKIMVPFSVDLMPPVAADHAAEGGGGSRRDEGDSRRER